MITQKATAMSKAPMSKAPMSKAPMSKAPMSKASISTGAMSKASMSTGAMSKASMSTGAMSKASMSKASMSKAPNQCLASIASNQGLAPLPPKFDWKVFKNIANVESIKTEDNAKTYFLQNAHINTPLRNKYFRESLKIPDYFDEELYVDFLQNEYNVKMKNGEIINDKLYAFYTTQGKNIYPLKDSYFREYYKIPKEFDEDLYKKIYQYSPKKEEFNSGIEKYLNIYNFYNKNETEYPITHEYLKIYFDTPDVFNYDLYKDIYNLNVVELMSNVVLENAEIYKKMHIYTHYKKNTNFLNDATYFKKYYNIPEHFDEEIYNNQYPEVKQQLKNAKNMQEKYEILNKNIIKNQSNAINKIAQPIRVESETISQKKRESATTSSLSGSIMDQLVILFPKIGKNELELFYNNELIRCKKEQVNNLFGKATPYQKYIIENMLDKSILECNDDILIVNYLEKKINHDEIYNLYMYLDNKSIKTNKSILFTDAYNNINTVKYLKIERNKEMFLPLTCIIDELFTIDNESDNITSLRGILCTNKLMTCSKHDKMILLANKYNNIYDIMIERNTIEENFKNMNNKKKNKTMIINYLVPSNDWYHYLVLMKNILFLEKTVNTYNFKINILNAIGNHELYNKFNNLINSQFNTTSIQAINSKTDWETFSDPCDLLFSSNILLTNKTIQPIKNLLYKVAFHDKLSYLGYIELYN